MMQYLGRRYVPYINHTYARSATVWEGRYKGYLIEEERYLFTCIRYIELNPVRAKIVKPPPSIAGRAFRPMPMAKKPLSFRPKIASSPRAGMTKPHERPIGRYLTIALSPIHSKRFVLPGRREPRWEVNASEHG